MKYVIGIDYGTDSCRALIVDAISGEEIAAAVKNYPRWSAGKYCDPQANQYRQHPLDYTETLIDSVREALSKSPEDVAENVVGISFDTTGSTSVLIDKRGTPLALLSEFSENPNAMFILWKDHTAIGEAAEINRLAKQWPTDYTMYSGGIYSGEWVWAKMAHVLHDDRETLQATSLREAAYSWVEHCDWMTALLTGNTKPEKMLRSRCAAGHKAMWHASWDGLPSEEFITAFEPLLSGIRSRLYTHTQTGGTFAGCLTSEWAAKLGLTAKVAVGVGALDCHAGAVGAQIKSGTFVRVMGTSTCDVMVVPNEQMQGKLISGICGQVDGSVIEGMIGLEAGQSAFGDIYAWFSKLVGKSISELTLEAEKLPVSETIIATDWLNGRRTPDANQALTGTITGLTLGATPAMIFRSLVEATAYGSKAIIDCFAENHIHIEEVIAIGGISRKSPFVMQILANVLDMPIKVAKAEQACALGAAMFAAVAAGVYADVAQAQTGMGKGIGRVYTPNAERCAVYSKLYQKYLDWGRFAEWQSGES
ncbi:MAG: ribulokinase [Dysgonamonadaceae bacterium]|jgi:L-ribulokinase|nr:ribulokinase [Dysgonamonadaceae bacterium]